MAMLDPLFMDIDEVYSGDEFGLPYRDLVAEGVVASTDFAVTAGSGNSVDVAAGAAWVEGDTNTSRQPTYRCINDATVNLGVSPDPSNPRKVLVIIQIKDEAFTGTGREAELQALHGTPAASPSDPTLPDSALLLATLTVPAGAADSSAYTIADDRTRAFGLAMDAGADDGDVPAWDAALGRWVPTPSSGSIIYRRFDRSVINTTTETDLLDDPATLSIAAGDMSTNKTLRLRAQIEFMNNSGANPTFTIRLKFGATTIFTMTTAALAAAVNANKGHFWVEADIVNIEDDAVQTASIHAAYSPVTAAGTTGTVVSSWTDHEDLTEDTSAAKDLKLTAQMSTAHANFEVKLKSALVEIL